MNKKIKRISLYYFHISLLCIISMKKFLVKAITNDLINSYKGFNAALSAVDFTILSNVLNPKWCSAQVFLLDTPSR